MTTDATNLLDEPPALTVRQVAGLLQTSEGNVRGMIHDGHIAAVKLTPGACVGGSEWRVPRAALDRWLGPWQPVVRSGATARATPVGDGGLSREALRERAGLGAEPGPSSTYPAHGTLTDTPSGSVAPVHPEDSAPRQVVQLQGVTTLPDHPSEQYLSDEERARRRTGREREADRARRAMDASPPVVRRREGSEPPHPTDASTFGAGAA